MDDLTIDISITIREKRILPDYRNARIPSMLKRAAESIEVALIVGGQSEAGWGFVDATLISGKTTAYITGSITCGPFATQEHATAYLDMIRREIRQIIEGHCTLTGDAVELHDITADWDAESREAVGRLVQDSEDLLERKGI